MPRRKRGRDVIKDPETGEKLYRLSRIADEADLTLRTVQKHVREGHLKIRRIGPHGRPRVSESERRKYLGMEEPKAD